MSEPSNDVIWTTVVEALNETLEERKDQVSITPESRLANDLGVTSIDTIHLFLALDDRFDKNFDFHEIAMQDGQYRTDMTLQDLVDFIRTALERRGPESA